MYKETYDDINIRNKKYCVMDYIKEIYQSNDICLDLGCGSCRKIKKVANRVRYYYAIDYDLDRITVAKQKCIEHNNIILGVGDNFYLPFEDNKFDLVSCFMTKYNVGEVSRVLKERGIFIIETVGADDKRNLKLKFGKDQLGWRGRMLYDSSDKLLERIEKSLLPFFYINKIFHICFETFIKTDLLLELFQMTGEIRCFDKIQDRSIIQSLENENGCIKFNEERLIIIAEKK